MLPIDASQGTELDAFGAMTDGSGDGGSGDGSGDGPDDDDEAAFVQTECAGVLLASIVFPSADFDEVC